MYMVDDKKYNLLVQDVGNPEMYKMELYGATLTDIEYKLESSPELVMNHRRLLMTSEEIPFDFDYSVTKRDNELFTEFTIVSVDGYIE